MTQQDEKNIPAAPQDQEQPSAQKITKQQKKLLEQVMMDFDEVFRELAK